MKEAPNIWNKMQTPRLQLNLFVQVGSHHEPSLHTESQRGDCLTHSHKKKTSALWPTSAQTTPITLQALNHDWTDPMTGSEVVVPDAAPLQL